MLIDPAETVVLLPAQTRYEQRGGGTETTTERRILFSPEIPGRRIGEALPEWEIIMRVAERAQPDAARLIHFDDSAAIREEIARAVPFYDGIQRLKQAGDQVQWGGERLCERDGGVWFPTGDGRAKFSAINIGQHQPDGRLRLSTRRGKQFNSMVHRLRDPLTGANRSDVLISREDAGRLGVEDGAAVLVKSNAGELNARCRLAPITPGNVEVHWPEGNVLVPRGVSDPECGIPDYNTMVEVVPVNPRRNTKEHEEVGG
jgi:predicted molibdopterin-dependent oxidoreductase YjgC